MRINSNVILRPATESDFEWAYDIKSDAEYQFVSEHFGWDDAFQKSLHKKEWERTLPTVVEYRGDRVGFFSIEQEDGKEFFRRFFVSVEYRNLGIGNAVVSHLLEQYECMRKDLWLAVFKGNPAKRLYLKHGFKVMSTSPRYDYLCWSSRHR